MRGDEPSRIERKPRLRLFLSLSVLMILVMTGLGFFVSRTHIDRPRVEAMLVEWKRSASQAAQAQGYTFDLKYSDIRLEGGWFFRHARLVEPVLTLTPLGDPEHARSVSTASVDLAPDLFGRRMAKLVFTQPVVLTDARGRWRFSAPSHVTTVVEPFHGQDGDGIAYALTLPPHLTVERLGRQSDTVIGSTLLGFGKHSAVHGRVNATKATGRQDIEIHDLTLRRNDREVTIGHMESHIETSKENGAASTRYVMHLDALSGDGSWQSLGSANADLDIAIDALPATGEEGRAHGKNVHIERILLALPSAKMLATADLKTEPDELMPFGHGAVEIDHPGQLMLTLRRAGILRSAEQELANTMLAKTVPEWKGDDAPVRIEWKHEANAASYIGVLTFENFVAQLVAQLLDQSGGMSLLGTPPTLATAPSPPANAPVNNTVPVQKPSPIPIAPAQVIPNPGA